MCICVLRVALLLRIVRNLSTISVAKLSLPYPYKGWALDSPLPSQYSPTEGSRWGSSCTHVKSETNSSWLPWIRRVLKVSLGTVQ